MGIYSSFKTLLWTVGLMLVVIYVRHRRLAPPPARLLWTGYQYAIRIRIWYRVSGILLIVEIRVSDDSIPRSSRLRGWLDG